MRGFILTALLFSLCVAGWARGLSRYALILNDPAPIFVASRRDQPRLQSARAAIRSAHEAVKTQLRSRNILITGEALTVANAVFVSADPSQVSALKAIPGVKGVVRLNRFRLKLDAAEQLINVPAAWSLLGGTSNAGAGIKIAVIDTGIESTHPAFQDPTLTPPGSPVCDVAANCAYTNNKIIVARSYVSIDAAGTEPNPAADSRPDDYSARDRVGHGTAIAMAAAGVTTTGPSDTITGVAPKAFLGNYKVFGSPGVNDFASGDAIVSALDDAYSDGMDIAILSLGGPAFFGPADTGATCGLSAGQPCDFEVSIVQTVTQNGMLVVVAAGNEGQTGSVEPSLGTVSSPGDAPGALTVAATTNSHQWISTLTINGLGNFNSNLGSGPVPASPLTGPLSDVASVGDPLACNAVPANSLSGTIALVQRGTCTFVQKVQILQVAGAIGVIITNNPGDDTLLVPGGLGPTTIPSVFIDYNDGQTIRNYLGGNPKTTVTIDPTVNPINVSTYNQIAPFSSMGPVLVTGGIKPDVAAVGTDLYLAAQNYDPNGDLYSANGYIISQGTSFSTPQIAGVAALVKQQHPQLSPLQIRSAVINTSTQDVMDGGQTASVLAVGAGKANAASAIQTNLIASPASITFGIIRSGVLPETQQIQFLNIGTSTLNLSVAITRRTAENNAQLSVNLPNLTIQPGQTGSVNVTLSGTLPSPGIYEGFISIQGSAGPIQIPYLYIVPDGVPHDIISIAGDGDDGTAGQQNAEGGILFQVLDDYGIGVPNVAARFTVTSGGGAVFNSDRTTDANGFAGSDDRLGVIPGTNVFTGTAGGLSTTFTITSRYQPVISPNGAVNAANYALGGAAPGSYIALFGSNLSPITQAFNTSYLPVSIDEVSVSFDTPAISVPGYLWFVSPGQVNVQVPWELQQALQSGQTSVQMKVSVEDTSGALYNLPLTNSSPSFFQIASGGQNYAAALDESNMVVTPSNPVAQGHVVQLFLNGLGPVNNQPASGDPSPLTPATTTTTPIVTIGGQQAQVNFSGMTPTTIGLYQVNAVIPNTGPGVQPVTITIGGISSTASQIPVK